MRQHHPSKPPKLKAADHMPYYSNATLNTLKEIKGLDELFDDERPNDEPEAASTDASPDQSPDLLQLVRATKDRINAENGRIREERNSKRWKDERDPAEYKTQKSNQRATYAAEIADKEGREVRAYLKVVADTKAEKEVIAKQRHAERERKRWAAATQADKDRSADKVWVSRQRKKGLTDKQIEIGLAERAAQRLARGNGTGPYESNSDFGAF